MKKINYKILLFSVVVFTIMISSGCKMRKKNRCNSCPKWTEETIKPKTDSNRTDV